MWIIMPGTTLNIKNVLYGEMIKFMNRAFVVLSILHFSTVKQTLVFCCLNKSGKSNLFDLSVSLSSHRNQEIYLDSITSNRKTIGFFLRHFCRCLYQTNVGLMHSHKLSVQVSRMLTTARVYRLDIDMPKWFE